MDTLTDDKSAIHEELWRAWLEKGKQRDKAQAQKAKVVAGIVLILLATSVAFYVLMLR